MTILRDYQEAAIQNLRLSLARGNKRVMCQAATGAGKTKIAAAIVNMALEKGNRVCFTVPAISLIDQTVESFRKEGITDIGVIQGDHPLSREWAQVQVASVQTLGRREFPSTGLVIVDEAHLAYKAIYRWMDECPDLRFIGLSATPWTKGLGKRYDDLIIAATTSDLIERGFLSPFRVYAPSHPDLSGVATRAGDYVEEQLAEAMDKPKLTADIVSTWMQHGESRPTLCFAVGRGHAKSLQDEFSRAGVRAAYIDAYTPREERTRIGRELAAGRIKVVCNVGTLTTGVDWDVRCLILARPTKSEILYTQIIGRALRTAPGKDDAIILDHSDTTLRLGFVTDIRHERLDMGRENQSSGAQRPKHTPLPKECASPDCTYVKPAGVHKCPACGFEPKHMVDVEVEDGHLEQVTGGKAKFDKATKQLWWSGLLWYVENTGKKQGWAAHKYREKFEVWPRGLVDIAANPTPEVRNYVRAGFIRYAKQQEKMNRGGDARA